MDRQRRRDLKRQIRRAFTVYRIVETLPARYRDIIQATVTTKTDWNKMQETYYYSERQMRNILNEALEEVDRRLRDGEKPT